MPPDRGPVIRGPRRRRRDPTPGQRAQARRSLGFNPSATGIEAEQRKGRSRSDRAQRTAPAPAMPHIPVVRNPTHRQTQAAKTQIARAINRHVTGRTSQQQAASRDQVIRQVETDPRLKHFRDASHHYAKADERHAARLAGAAAIRGRTAMVPIFDQTPSGAARVVGYRRIPLSQAIGRGALKQIGRREIAQARRRNPGAHSGAPERRVGIGPATVSLPGVQRALAAGTSLDVGDIGPRRFAKALGSDVGALATGPFVGAYELGAGGVEAATGRGTGRLQRLGKGVAVSTYDTFRHPERSFREHPLLTGLTFAGGVGAVGRVGGAVARGAGSSVEAAGVRGALARAGSTARPPLAFSEDAATAGIRERTYSKDLSRKAVQVAQDRAREPLTRPDGSPVTVRQRGREVPVLKATERERERMSRKQGDFLAARANATERKVRDDVAREMRVRGVKGRRAQDLVAMVTEGTITSAEHFEGDLRAYRNMVAGELEREKQGAGVFHDRRQVQDAQETVARVDRLLADKRVLGQKDKIVEVGRQIGARLNESEAQAMRLGVLHPARAARARLIHPAVLHAGARHYTSAEIKALAKQGVDVSDEAVKHGALRTPEGRFLGNADVEEVLRAKGRDPSTVAYLPPGALGRRAFHARFNLSRPTIGGAETRTGEQFRRGLTTAGAETLREQGTKVAVQVEKARAIDRAVSEHGMKHPEGRYFTGKEAEEYAKRLERDTGERLVAVRSVPARAGKRMETLARGEQSPSAMESLGERLLNARLKVKPGTKNVVLMPAGLVERLQAHAAPAGSLVRLGQMVNRPFRMAVLPQFRWLTGNFVEPFAVRLSTAGSGINVYGLGQDLRATQKVLKSMERQPAEIERMAGDWAQYHQRAQADVNATQAAHAASEDAMRVLKLMRTARRGGTPNEQAIAWRKAQTIAARHGIHIPSVERTSDEAQAAYVKQLQAAVVQRYQHASEAGRNARAAAARVPEAERMRQAAKEIKAQLGQGLFVGGRGASVRRTLEEMPGAKVWGPVIAKTPVVRQMAEMTRVLGRGAMAPANAFFRMNRMIENVANRAAYGNTIRRDIQEFTGRYTETIRLGQKAVDEAARGLVNTPTQRRFMDRQHELLGKYEGFSPTTRALTQTIFPFLPWMLNAARFTFWTMPAHNTVKTALLMQVNQLVQKDWDEIHKDVPPGSLRYAIPNGKGGWIDLARYGPTGAFTEAAGGGGYQTFTSQLLPQVSGVVSALEGRDPFGRDLTAPKTPENPEGKANPLGVAVNQAVESMVPYVSTARRLREGGGTPYSTSTVLNPKVKPGTAGQMSALRRTFDPLRPTYLRNPVRGGGGGAALSPADQHDIRQAIESTQLSPADQVDIEEAIRAAGG